MSENLITSEMNNHFVLLGEHTAELWKCNRMTDILIEIQENSFSAHKSVLTCYSPYFKKLLMEPSKSINKIKLKSVTPEAFKILLNYMYSGKLIVNCQNIADVYQASKKLEMHDVTDKCNSMLTISEGKITNLLYVYVTAKKLGLDSTWKRALNTMARNFEDVIACEDFVELDAEQVCEFLSVDVIGARSEVFVFLAALKWLEHNYTEREKYIKQVIENVRFSMMTLEEIVACYHPPILPGIIEHACVRNLITDATCYVSAKMCGQAEKFVDYYNPQRYYLLSDHPLELWNMHEYSEADILLGEKTKAAKQIQLFYKYYKLRKRLRKRKEHTVIVQDAIRSYINKKILERHQYLKDTIKYAGRSKVSPENHLNNLDTLTTDPLLLSMIDKSNSSPDWNDTVTRNLTKITGSIQLQRTSVLLLLGGMNPLKLEQMECGTSILRYHPIENKWEKCCKLPFPRHHMATVCLKDNIYCIGGCDLRETLKGNIMPTSTCFRYNYVNKRWGSVSSMRHCRMYHGVATLFGIIYTVGGKDETKQLLSSIECYRTDTDTWFELKDPLSNPRMGMGVASHKGLLWIVGGMIYSPRENKVFIIKDIECFNPKTNRWLNFAKLPKSMNFISLVEHEKKLYVIGGSGKRKNHIASLADVYCYDDESDEWFICSSLPSPKHGAATVSLDNKLFVISDSASFQTQNYSELLCLENMNGFWTMCEPVPYPIYGTTAISLPPLKSYKN